MECKDRPALKKMLKDIDLIETLWNVKERRQGSLVRQSGFNRNIVECKGKYVFPSFTKNADLIETLWNVKKDKCARLYNLRRI